MLTLNLEYVNKTKAFQDNKDRDRLDQATEREEMITTENEMQLAADHASHHAILAEEDVRQLLDQARMKAEATMAAAREEQKQGRAAVEAAMAEAARAKEEADLQFAEGRRAQAEANTLIEANRRIQDQAKSIRGPSNDGRLVDQLHHVDIMKTAEDAATSLDQLNLLCDAMDEAQAMCLHIHERLICLAQQISGPQFIEDESIQTEYADIVDRFRALLAQYGGKRVIARIVSGRVIVSVCREIHKVISALAQLCAVICGDHSEWETRFESDSETQRGLLRLAQSQDHVLLSELGDTAAQEEALTLLLFEIDHRARQYEPRELQLINRVFQSVASYSRLVVPSVPSWFIPPHEVELVAQITCGAFGAVYRGSWIGTDVAVKSVLFLEDSETRQAFLNEAEIWSSLQHPHIVKLFGACHVGNPFFVCEYASSGNLSEYLYRPENHHKTWKCLHEAACGLWYLHAKRKIVHRDIKSNNIVIGHDGVAKLTDFGLSCPAANLPSSGNASEVGAIRWKAPECISGESSGSFASDVYSFGMTIIEAVTGRLPFGTMPDVTVKFKVVKFHELPKQPVEMTDSQWDLIQRMCATNPNDRIAMATAVDALKDFADEEYYDHMQKEWDLAQSKAPDRPQNACPTQDLLALSSP